MTAEFRALRITSEDGGRSIRPNIAEMTLDELTPGDVVVKVLWSGINFKDALAVTGKGRILRKFPLNAGIDLAGTVVESSSADFNAGDEVVVCGGSLSEIIDGGYSEYARLPADIVVPLPSGLSLKEAMTLGTAGFTAALAIERMEALGQEPGLGPVLVNGATGGVGSFSINLLSRLGYEVVAVSGKADKSDYLKSLGATRVVAPDELGIDNSKPLAKSVWGGAVDSLGGDMLGWLTRSVNPRGNIASIGLAAGIKLESTVMPFILRGISLIGVNSVEIPRELVRRLWLRLGSDLRPSCLDMIVADTVSLDDLPQACTRLMERRVTGRILVSVQ